MKERTKTVLRLGLHEVLRTIEDMVIIGMTHPKGRNIARDLFRNTLKKRWKARKYETKRFDHYLAYCREKGYILDTVAANGSLYHELTDKGKRRLAAYVVSDTGKLLTQRRKHLLWDGRWRLVIFDIPEKDRRKRDAVRDALVGSGFLTLQKSVFAYPFPCTPLIHSLVEAYNLGTNVQLLIADIIENEAQTLEYFLADGILTEKQIRAAEIVRTRRRKQEALLN